MQFKNNAVKQDISLSTPLEQFDPSKHLYSFYKRNTDSILDTTLLDDEALTPKLTANILASWEHTIHTDENSPHEISITTNGGDIECCNSILGFMETYNPFFKRNALVIGRVHVKSIGLLLLLGSPCKRLVYRDTVLMLHDYKISKYMLSAIQDAFDKYDTNDNLHYIYTYLKNTDSTDIEPDIQSVINYIFHVYDHVVPNIERIISNQLKLHNPNNSVPVDKFNQLMDTAKKTGVDTYITPEEALEYGFIDGIL